MDASKPDSGDSSILPVEIVTVREIPIDKEESFESFLFANKDAFLTSKIYGTVEEVYVQLGDWVNRGDTLAKIEDETLLLEYRLAQKLFEQAQEDFVRTQTLYEKKMISESDFEKMKLKCEQADIEQQLAHEKHRQTRVIAPFSGAIVSVWAKIGQTVIEGDSLFHLTEKYPVYTRIFLSEEEAERLITEGEVTITPKYGESIPCQGRIIRKSPIIETASGTVELLIRLDDSERKLTPGRSVNVFLRSKASGNCLAVSKKAILPGRTFSSQETTSVCLCLNGRAKRKTIRIEDDLDSLWTIQGELQAGDSVIVVGSMTIPDGQIVIPLQTTPVNKP